MTKWWWKRSTNAGMTISIKAPYQKIISYILWSSILSYDDPIIMIWWSLLVILSYLGTNQVPKWPQGITKILLGQTKCTGSKVLPNHPGVIRDYQMLRCQSGSQVAPWNLPTQVAPWTTHLPRCLGGTWEPTYPGGTWEPTYPGGTWDNPPTQVARWQHQHPGQVGWFAPPCATGLVWPQLHSDQDVRRDSARSAPSRLTTSQASMLQFTWPNWDTAKKTKKGKDKDKDVRHSAPGPAFFLQMLLFTWPSQ